MTNGTDLAETQTNTTAPGALEDLTTRVTRIRVDGRLEVTTPDGDLIVGAEDLPERRLRSLAAGADPMALPELAGVLAGVDLRRLRAEGASMEEALAAYATDVDSYRSVVSAAATIVRFCLQAEPLKRRSTQEEAALVLGLTAATEPGGAMHAHRVWLDALTVLAHYIRLAVPEEFVHLAPLEEGCVCLAHLAAGAIDPATAARPEEAVFLAATLAGSGLVALPLGISGYLRHRDLCPRAVAEDMVCSCGLAELTATGAAAVAGADAGAAPE